jgi:hypothetical protein
MEKFKIITTESIVKAIVKEAKLEIQGASNKSN